MIICLTASLVENHLLPSSAFIYHKDGRAEGLASAWLNN